MKTTLVTSFCSLALALVAFGQTPTITPPDPAAPTAPPLVTPVAPVAPSPSVTMNSEDADDLESRIERKVKRGLHITFGDDDEDRDVRVSRREQRHRDRDRGDRVHIRSSDNDDTALMAIPIVGIIFTTLFGAPVMIVGVIMFFSYWKQRQLHRTVRMMVEKGQPVPEGLFTHPPTPIKLRSDMRRGVVLVMIGLGVMVFFAAVNDWEGGAWALGIIPFLIGCGYLLVWKLDADKFNSVKASTDNPPPLP